MLDRRLFHWEKNFTRTVLRLAVPIVVQSLMIALMHIVDNLMIGQLGEYQLAGVTQANRITFLLQVTMFGVVSGASIFTAQYWGKRDLAGIHRTLGLGMITGLGVAALFAIPSILCPEVLIRLLIHEEHAMEAGAAYLRVVGFAYLVQALSTVQAAVLKSTEQVKLPMAGSILAIVANTLLNYMLIFGKWGAPKLGVTGGAIATLIGSCLELALLLFVGYRYNLPNAARLKAFAFTRLEAKRYFRVVLPTMLNEGFWSLGMVVYSGAYGLMGASTVAAVSIYNSVEQLSSVVLRGATHACAVMIGMAIGAGREQEASLTAKRMLLGSSLAGLVGGLFVMGISGFVVSWFNVSVETARSAHTLINTYACFLWLQALASLLIVGILRAGGDVKYAMVTDIAPVWLVGIPLVFIFGPGMGWSIQHVYLLTRIEELVKSVIAFGRMRSGKWIHNLIAHEAPQDAAQSSCKV
ncbi:MAG: MATE family efflux transporter [Clostridia bacterium]